MERNIPEARSAVSLFDLERRFALAQNKVRQEKQKRLMFSHQAKKANSERRSLSVIESSQQTPYDSYA